MSHPERAAATAVPTRTITYERKRRRNGLNSSTNSSGPLNKIARQVAVARRRRSSNDDNTIQCSNDDVMKDNVPLLQPQNVVAGRDHQAPSIESYPIPNNDTHHRCDGENDIHEGDVAFVRKNNFLDKKEPILCDSFSKEALSSQESTAIMKSSKNDATYNASPGTSNSSDVNKNSSSVNGDTSESSVNEESHTMSKPHTSFSKRNNADGTIGNFDCNINIHHSFESSQNLSIATTDQKVRNRRANSRSSTMIPTGNSSTSQPKIRQRSKKTINRVSSSPKTTNEEEDRNNLATWYCSFCTYHNYDWKKRRCEVCAKRRAPTVTATIVNSVSNNQSHLHQPQQSLPATKVDDDTKITFEKDDNSNEEAKEKRNIIDHKFIEGSNYAFVHDIATPASVPVERLTESANADRVAHNSITNNSYRVEPDDMAKSTSTQMKNDRPTESGKHLSYCGYCNDESMENDVNLVAKIKHKLMTESDHVDIDKSTQQSPSMDYEKSNVSPQRLLLRNSTIDAKAFAVATATGLSKSINDKKEDFQYPLNVNSSSTDVDVRKLQMAVDQCNARLDMIIYMMKQENKSNRIQQQTILKQQQLLFNSVLQMQQDKASMDNVNHVSPHQHSLINQSSSNQLRRSIPEHGSNDNDPRNDENIGEHEKNEGTKSLTNAMCTPNISSIKIISRNDHPPTKLSSPLMASRTGSQSKKCFESEMSSSDMNEGTHIESSIVQEPSARIFPIENTNGLSMGHDEEDCHPMSESLLSPSTNPGSWRKSSLLSSSKINRNDDAIIRQNQYELIENKANVTTTASICSSSDNSLQSIDDNDATTTNRVSGIPSSQCDGTPLMDRLHHDGSLIPQKRRGEKSSSAHRNASDCTEAPTSRQSPNDAVDNKENILENTSAIKNRRSQPALGSSRMRRKGSDNDRMTIAATQCSTRDEQVSILQSNRATNCAESIVEGPSETRIEVYDDIVDTTTIREHGNQKLAPGELSTGWISNNPSRQFILELEDVTTMNASSSSKQATKKIRQSTSSSALVPWESSRRQLKSKCGEVRSYQERNPSSMHAATDENSNKKLISRSDQPNYAYKETVRCKSEREGLPCYDCATCRRFYQVLHKTGHELSNSQQRYIQPLHEGSNYDDAVSTSNKGRGEINNNEKLPMFERFSRHRALYPPAETPTDFWELDFIDEMPGRQTKK